VKGCYDVSRITLALAMNSRTFHLGDVLTVTTGLLLAPRGMEAVYDILNFMTGDDLYTHQLPRARNECASNLLEQHPHLATVEVEGVTPENFAAKLEELTAEYGEAVLVAPLPAHAHEFIDPMSELAEKIHPDNIIRIEFPPKRPRD